MYMESFIKKIAEGKCDESVHLQLMKFSRGEFTNRAVVVAKKTGKGFSISTSPEYCNELVRGVAEKLGDDESVDVSGAIISTKNLKEVLEFSDLLAHCEVKQFQGVKRFIINNKMTKKQIIGICDEVPKSFIGLSFKTEDTELKIKPKAPKSGKPGKGDEKPKADFCKIKTSDVNLVKGIVFDVENFKCVEITHEFIITNIEIPKDETDPLLMREKAIREGKVVRRICVDGQEKIKELPFRA